MWLLLLMLLFCYICPRYEKIFATFINDTQAIVASAVAYVGAAPAVSLFFLLMFRSHHIYLREAQATVAYVVAVAIAFFVSTMLRLCHTYL